MSDHETTLRAYHAEWQREMDATMGAGSLHGGRDPELAAACLAVADALRRGTCGTCRYRIAADRNCQLLVMPVESGQTIRPGDANFSCTLYAPTETTR